MKRFAILAVLAAVVLGSAVSASAIVDVKASGSWRVAATWEMGDDLRDFESNAAGGADNDDQYEIYQRVNTAFQFIANENLRGVWQIEIGTQNWGGAAFDVGADFQAVETKHAYIQFMIPNTEMQITAGGAMPVALPNGAMGNPVLDDDIPAVVLSTPLIDGVGLIAGYARLGRWGIDPSDANIDNELDAAVLALPMTFDWLSLTPYAMFAWSGERWLEDVTLGETNYGNIPAGLVSQNASLGGTGISSDSSEMNSVDVWWGGLAFGLDFDPINIDGHFVYGALDGQDNLDRAGWETDLSIEYTGLDFMTPKLVFMWTSGEDGNGSNGEDGPMEDGGKSERLPIISGAGGYTPFWDGGMAIIDGTYGLGQGDEPKLGFWTLGLELNDISFIENLTHNIGVYYIQGTNDDSLRNTNLTGNGQYGNGVAYSQTLTEDDSMWDYGMRTEYQMYDQLTFILNLNYLSVDMDDTDENDENAWDDLNGDYEEQDSGGVQLGVRYDF